jgi:hypothetical protein
MDLTLTPILAFQAAISGFLCMTVARQKGYSDAGWFFTGLVTGISGVIAIAGMPLTASAEAEL